MTWTSFLERLLYVAVGAVAGIVLTVVYQRYFAAWFRRTSPATPVVCPYMASGIPTPTTDEYKASLGIPPSTPLFTPMPGS